MKKILQWSATFICAVLVSQPATSQDWPARPIRFITAFAIGGSSDQMARIIAERLSASVGQQIVVDNRSGANGVVGTALAAKSAPDGYNYLIVFDSHATNPSLNKKLPYDTAKDFTPIMLLASSPFGLVVNPESPYQTLAALISAAKARPGELTLGSSGVGSRGHLGMALLERRAGFKVTQVTYRGPAQIMADLMGGQITMQLGTFFFVSPFVKSQRVRALAVTSATRMPQLPDVPTVAEQGFPGYELRSWWGIVAPSGVPQRVLQKMHGELDKTLARPDLRTKLEQLGATVHASSPEEFKRHIAAEMQLWGKVVHDSKISAVR